MTEEQYIKNKLAEINSTYNVLGHLGRYSDKDIKKRWKEDEKRTYNLWLSVKSVSDVERFVNQFIATVKQFENINGLFQDAYVMDLSLYRAENAIQKMAQCYNDDEFDFETFKENDIDNMFNTLYEGIKSMEKVNQHRAM